MPPNLVVRPTQVGDSPHAHATANQHPKRLRKPRVFLASTETHGGREEAGEDLERISQNGTKERSAEIDHYESVQNDHGESEKQYRSEQRAEWRHKVLVPRQLLV